MSIRDLIITDRPHLTESSMKTYLFSLKKLGITETRDIKIVENPKEIFKMIEPMKINQRRNLLSAILIIITASGEGSELYETYRSRLFDLGVEYNAIQAENKKTETQERNWVTMEELKKITRSRVRQSPGCQLSLIAALYTYNVPCRLDYYDCEIVKSDEGLNEDKNYLLIKSAKEKEFIFNDYKTFNKYGQSRVAVSKNLNTVINKFLKLNPERKYLLQQKRQPLPLSRNQLGKMIPVVFAKTGKQVSINIIRHCFISQTVNLEEIKKLHQLSKDMHHSTTEQINYAKFD